MEQNLDASTSIAPVAENNKQNGGGNGLKIATAIACIVAVCGIGFGVYGMFFHETKTSDNDSFENVSAVQDDDNVMPQKELPSIENITSLLKDKYGLFDQNNYTEGVGTLLSVYYNEDGEGFNGASKLFLLIDQEYPYTDCGDVQCYKTVAYNDFNNKYHEYFGNSEDIEKGINYTVKHPWVGADIEYVENEDSFKITYPTGLGGRSISSGYYTNIVDMKRTNEGSIIATAIVTKVDAENAKLFGTSGCLNAFDCPYIDMRTLAVKSFLYEYVFIEEDGSYKLIDIVEQ